MNNYRQKSYRRFEISVCKECGRLNIWENVNGEASMWREACSHKPDFLKILYNRGPWVRR